MNSVKNRKKIHILIIAVVIIITTVFIFFKTEKTIYEQPALIKAETISPSQEIASAIPETNLQSTPPINTTSVILDTTFPDLPVQMQSTDKFFTKSSNFSSAYLIFPNADTKATKMLSGFDLTVNKLDVNNFEINLVATENPDEKQTFTISTGQKIYFIKRSSDRNHLNRGGKYTDNYAVAVNMQGYILK